MAAMPPRGLDAKPAAGCAPRPVLGDGMAWPLHGPAASRSLEQAALARRPPHALIERAGLAVARLAAALAPHRRKAWLACGPGNNGGDGLIAAAHLARWGWSVQVSLIPGQNPPADALHALALARAQGVVIATDAGQQPEADLVVDALLGLGAGRAPAGAIALLVQRINALGASGVPVVAVDLPSGLDAATGRALGPAAVQASDTLSLLTLKPGLFTAMGRTLSGRVWFDALGLPPEERDALGAQADAWLSPAAVLAQRPHDRHKGHHGDVQVLGGAPGMGGAARLAARAALAAGGGRIYLTLLDGTDAADLAAPELMLRTLAEAMDAASLAGRTVVCGCGGGSAVAALLPEVIAHSARLVLDADALNALAASPALQQQLADRATPTVLTPHPLEAARLLGLTAAQVQADRLTAAQQLADRFAAVVVLKGSGSVVAAPGLKPRINGTGNARLATAGSGDVLAGWLGGAWASGNLASSLPQAVDARSGHAPDPGVQATAQRLDGVAAVVWLHGRAAEVDGPATGLPLTAGRLIEAMVLTARAQPGQPASDRIRQPGVSADAPCWPCARP